MTYLNCKVQPDLHKTWYFSVFRVTGFEFQIGGNKIRIEDPIYEKLC